MAQNLLNDFAPVAQYSKICFSLTDKRIGWQDGVLFYLFYMDSQFPNDSCLE
jgi:hypothetical protein